MIGVSFRVQGERAERLYVRPENARLDNQLFRNRTNGRADDQLRRNHSVQYASLPDYPWNRLRAESPRQVRVVRRPSARRVDAYPDRRERPARDALRERRTRALPSRDRPQNGRIRRDDRPLDRTRHPGLLLPYGCHARGDNVTEVIVSAGAPDATGRRSAVRSAGCRGAERSRDRS